MLQDTKLSLSDHDLEMVRDRLFLQTKREILAKIAGALAATDIRLRGCLEKYASNLPSGWDSKKAGKISRGENLLGMPYLVLDQPSVYSREGICAFRILFWWGHGFFLSLHISGNYASWAKQLEFSAIPDGSKILTGNDPWSYDHSLLKTPEELAGHYNGPDDLLNDLGFLKIVSVLPFKEIPDIEDKANNFLEWVLERFSQIRSQ